MKIICNVENAFCPEGKNICCGACERFKVCINACTDVREDYQHCSEALVVQDELTTLEAEVPQTLHQMADLLRAKKAIDEREKELKAELVKAMEKFGIKSFDNNLIKLTYIAPTTRNSVDSAKLKKNHPDIYAECLKTSNVSASVRVELKGAK